MPFGTLYAFSVFLKPMEALLGAIRAEMSFVFGLATVTLTLGMSFAPQLYRRVSPAALAALVGPGAGVLFIVAQQAVNQTVVKRRGLANGYVVSLYPLGAMLGAPVLGWSIEVHGVRSTLAGLGVFALAACMVASAVLRAADVRMLDASSNGGRGTPGLTVLSQAAAIVQAYGGAAALAVGATSFITGAVGAARIAGGWLVDHFAAARVGVYASAVWIAAGINVLGALIALRLPVPPIANAKRQR